MQYSVVAEAYEAMGKTTKRLELTQLLVGLIKKTPKELIDKIVYLTQGKLYPDYTGIEIGVADRLAVRAISLSSGLSVDRVESIYKKTGDVGLAASEVLKSKTQTTLYSEPLTVESVHDNLDKIARTSGHGSLEMRLRSLCSMLNSATPIEAKHLMRTVTGKLRLGVADYTVLDALAVAYAGGKEHREALERAYNLSSDLGAVAKAVATKGLEGIRRFRVQVGRPIRSMLAERLETTREVVEKMGGKCAAEYKLDGERVQIHKADGAIQIFSRRLENITSHYPDVAKLSSERVSASKAILEAEVVAVNVDTGEYLPFQELMHRRRKYGIKEAMRQYPVALNYFDVLYTDGADYTSKPYSARRAALEKIIKRGDGASVVPSIITDNPAEMEDFMEQAITEGCEGLIVKDLKSPYRAGAREFAWVKLKREYRSELTDTIDLVIVGAFYGRGKRAGRYGTYLLAAYNKTKDVFQTASKVGTGFTDKDLEDFTSMLEPYKVSHVHSRVDSKMKADVWFVPQFVIETIASEITLSPIHSCGTNAIRKGSGLALRFPKYTGRLRDDKKPEDATTTDEIIEMYKRQLKRIEEQPQAVAKPGS